MRVRKAGKWMEELRLLEEAWCERDADRAAAACLKEFIKLTHLVCHLGRVLHVKAHGAACCICHGSNGLATLAHHLALHGVQGRGHRMTVVGRDGGDRGNGAVRGLNWFNTAGLGLAIEEADERHATILSCRCAGVGA